MLNWSTETPLNETHEGLQGTIYVKSTASPSSSANNIYIMTKIREDKISFIALTYFSLTYENNNIAKIDLTH